ncbi:MAG: Crp/Fnr family transcriptional regulator [Deltaproteobacteria bacterium HGW-Deltaproteobacteria-8]|jgi:CRP-like cAMP-binding protein|nr:MAG: Crp/Fnr family transcriptional regulator [Deltaproteobacteria bacterium HGW-Deltaproteobacteria-8]
MEQGYWHLGVEDFFTGLEQEKRTFLARSRRKALPKFAAVFDQGEPSRSCYYLEKGLVRIYGVSSQGKEPIFFMRRAGEMFGLAEVLESPLRRAGAQTLTASVLHEMDRRELELFLDENPRVARKVICILGRRLRYLSDQVGGLIANDVGTRLAKLLLCLCAESFANPASRQGPVDVPLKLTQEQMAAMVGSCQQTVCQFLKKFQDEGLIQVEMKQITLLDPTSLISRAEE